MISMIITSLLLMAAVVIIRSIFRRKLSGKLLMLVWAVVFVKLAVPVNIPSELSVMNIISSPANGAEISAAETNYSFDNITPHYPNNTEKPAAPAIYTDINIGQESVPVSAKNTEKKISIGEIANRIYIIVTVLLEAAVIAAYIICAVRFSRFEAASVPERFEEKGLRFRKGNIDTPAVFGIFRPVILIPDGTDTRESVTLEHIILHEKTHIRHRDQLWNFLTLMICCANWYNPLVWVCRVLYLKDAEKWCDEAVIKSIGGENRKSYAQSLLVCANSAAERTRPFMLLSGFGESDIKGRIKAIMSNRKFRRGASIAVVLLTAVSATAFGTGKAVRAEMTDIGFVSSDDGVRYVQSFEGNSGEKAEVSLLFTDKYGLYKEMISNYNHFILSIDSSDYTIEDAHIEIKAEGVSSWRMLPDGEKTEDKTSFICSEDLSNDKNDIELAINFNDKIFAKLSAVVTYKLKKGAFTAGTYTMEADFTPEHIRAVNTTYMMDLDRINERIESRGFTAEVNNGRYEIRSSEGNTDLYLFFYDEKYGDHGVTVTRAGDEKEIHIDYFNPYSTYLGCSDITGDGVNDLTVITPVSGTGVVENVYNFIDGAKFCEIPVDARAAGEMIKDYVRSEEFAFLAEGDIFPYDSHHGLSAGNALFPYFEDEDYEYLDAPLLGYENIHIYGGLTIEICGSICGRAVYALGLNDEKYSGIYIADMEFEYRDGVLEPVRMSHRVPQRLEEMGLTKLIDLCEVWDMAMCSDTFIDISVYNDTIEIDGESDYSEYRIDARFPELIPNIEEALGVKLELSDDGYYKCPFSSVSEVRSSAERLFSERYINDVYDNFPHIKEYNGSLYAQLGGKGYAGGYVYDARINEISKDRINFTASFTNGNTDDYQMEYTFIKENGGWKFDGKKWADTLS